jgi:hypothetical protein
MIKFLESIHGEGRAFSITVMWKDEHWRIGTATTYDLLEVDQFGITAIAEGCHSGPGGTYLMCIPWHSIEWVKVNFAD